jgi:glyoxylase-like metal-dependent hydrolase (beta-lactamase superfamily II)
MTNGSLVEVGDGAWAWLQRDGGWGWSNAGLVTDGEASLLVDTLYDVPLTAAMLKAMRDATPAAAHIDTLVNTHANGDHTYGNQLVADATIVASADTAAEFADVTPSAMAKLVRQARFAQKLPWPLSAIPLGCGVTVRDFAEFALLCFGAFDYAGVRLTPPTETYTGQATWKVGDKDVHFLQVGPAHTRGDTLVHVPSERLVYTGDILFASGHPISWEGPLSRWVEATHSIEAMDVDVVVPGHGPVATMAHVRRLRDYLETVQREATARFHAGMPVLDAARDIALDAFDDWNEAERLVVNVHNVYRELGGEDRTAHQLFLLMTALKR